VQIVSQKLEDILGSLQHLEVTYAMADQFEKDLRQLKSEGGL